MRSAKNKSNRPPRRSVRRSVPQRRPQPPAPGSALPPVPIPAILWEREKHEAPEPRLDHPPVVNQEATAGLPPIEDSKLLLMAQDPLWLYAGWRLDTGSAHKHLALAVDSQLTLRVFIDSDAHQPWVQVPVAIEADHCFIQVGRADTRYVAELGYVSHYGFWMPLLISNRVQTPGYNPPPTRAEPRPDPAVAGLEQERQLTPSSDNANRLPTPAVTETIVEPPRPVEAGASEGMATLAGQPELPPQPEPLRETPADRPAARAGIVAPPEAAMIASPSQPVSTSTPEIWMLTLPLGVPFEAVQTAAKSAALPEAPLVDTVQRLQEQGQALASVAVTQVCMPGSGGQPDALGSTLNLFSDAWKSAGIPAPKAAWWPESSALWPTTVPAGLSSWMSAPTMATRWSAGKSLWLDLNAEVVIEGATDPNARMWIAGSRVPLRPDGAFTLRLALPDGRFELPFLAVTADGTETCPAIMHFERHTGYQDQIGLGPVDPQLLPPGAAEANQAD